MFGHLLPTFAKIDSTLLMFDKFGNKCRFYVLFAQNVYVVEKLYVYIMIFVFPENPHLQANCGARCVQQLTDGDIDAGTAGHTNRVFAVPAEKIARLAMGTAG